MHSATEQLHPGIRELYRSLDPEDTGTAVSVIVKVRGETCDIDCLYCYEKRKEAPGGARVEPGQIERLGEIFRGRPLAVELHGGEPLTAGHDTIVAILRALARQPGVLRVTLQTNGVLLDETWLDLFDELCPSLQIGVSLDGDAQGNAWRLGYNGEPVYPRVAAALRLLADRRRPVGVIAAVTPQILGRAEAVLDHIAGFGSVNAVSFVPCFDAGVRRPTASATGRRPASRVRQEIAVADDRPPAWAVHPDEYAEFVLEATAHWITSGLFRRLKLEPAVSTIRRLRGVRSGFCHFSDLKCDHVFTLYPDGRLGSCDELPWPQARLGLLPTLREEADVRAAQEGSRLLAQGKALMQKCVSCSYHDTCGGGCVATRWRMDRSEDPDAYCDYRMRLVDGTAALLAQSAHPQGAHCRTLRWHPRTPNTMADVNAFLARWDTAGSSSDPVRLHASVHGNINTAGLPGVHAADDLHPGHPRWRESIEDGAWPLVEAITDGWGLVTYDSCQGHLYAGLDLEPAVRRIGILPRTPDEYAQTAAALCRALKGLTLPAAVSLTPGRSELTCEATGLAVPVLDLLLQPADGHSWNAYFAQLDRATTTLAEALRREQPDSMADCPCPRPATTAATEEAR
jgi:uncharacterized protein